MEIQLIEQMHTSLKKYTIDTTIRTTFLPAEIVAIRADGVCETTNSKAQARRHQERSAELTGEYMRGRGERDAELETEVKRLEGELKSANDELQNLHNDRTQFSPLEPIKSALYGIDGPEVAKLKAELKRLNTELALKNKWIEGARELEVIRSKLAENLIYI